MTRPWARNNAIQFRGQPHEHYMKSRYRILELDVLLLLVALAMASLPYNPTTIISPLGNDSDFVYVFQQPSSSSSSLGFHALNISGVINSVGLPYSAISNPFDYFNGGSSDAYIPIMNRDGSIVVFSGNCQDGTKGSTLWSFTPDSNINVANGTWLELDLAIGAETGDGGVLGATFLASGISFSGTVNTTSQLYIFGGMCPNETASSTDGWTKLAVYSDTMLTIEPPQMSSPNTYNLGALATRESPVAEAGFTMTPLEPTFSQSSGENQSQQQNQNFILLGGHTQQAFVNMSQAALFSLPEQSWSFLSIQSPSTVPNTDLAARDATIVEPRSGHTALLTSDGTKLIVYGGWVGDVTTSANPQLAILELGDGYGGIGDWQWSIPSQTEIGPEDGAGLFGHGAVMLPGSVMMILGGYSISKTVSGKTRRANPSLNDKSYFFNTTSNTWIPSYTHPKPSSDPSDPPSSSAHTQSIIEKAGLAAGLSFGFLAIVLLAFFYLWYTRRLKRQRIAREDELRSLAIDAHRIDSVGLESGGPRREMAGSRWMRERGRVATDAYPWASGPPGVAAAAAGRRDGDTEAERTGLLFEIPSPTRGLRRSLHSRGTYQPAPRYDEGRLNHGSNNIHPIDERDEYEEEGVDDNVPRKFAKQEKQLHILQSAPALDPFQDPRESSRTPSPESPTRARELEVRNWVSDWAAADALLHHQAGRISPDKTDRTSSTLSEQSTRSTLSAHSYQPSVGAVSRSMSQRSAAFFSTNPFSTSNSNIKTTTVMTAPSENYSNQHSPHRYSPDHRRSQSLTLFSNSQPPNTSDTFATAPTSFSQLQMESETLLGGLHRSGDGSPSKLQSRAKGWMGSVRRAFVGADRNPSSENGARSASSSPVKFHHTDAGIPRRAASASAMLWQKRQGAKDWGAEGGLGENRGDMAGPYDGGDEEWDVESAVERRVVQVMFTVPREKLRIVNGGPEGDGESILSTEVKEGEKGDAGSGKGKGKEKGAEADEG